MTLLVLGTFDFWARFRPRRYSGACYSIYVWMEFSLTLHNIFPRWFRQNQPSLFPCAGWEGISFLASTWWKCHFPTSSVRAEEIAEEEQFSFKEPEDIFQSIYSQSRNPRSQTQYKHERVPKINLFTTKMPLWILNKLINSRGVPSTWINTGFLCKTKSRSYHKITWLWEIQSIKGCLLSSLVMLYLTRQWWARLNCH